MYPIVSYFCRNSLARSSKHVKTDCYDRMPTLQVIWWLLPAQKSCHKQESLQAPSMPIKLWFLFVETYFIFPSAQLWTNPFNSVLWIKKSSGSKTDSGSEKETSLCLPSWVFFQNFSAAMHSSGAVEISWVVSKMPLISVMKLLSCCSTYWMSN